MKWVLILLISHCVHSRPGVENADNKHCIKMTTVKEQEINTILAKLTAFLNKIADEHEDFDITNININFEAHSDDESEEKETNLRIFINDCEDIKDYSHKNEQIDTIDVEIRDEAVKDVIDEINSGITNTMNEVVRNVIDTAKDEEIAVISTNIENNESKESFLEESSVTSTPVNEIFLNDTFCDEDIRVNDKILDSSNKTFSSFDNIEVKYINKTIEDNISKENYSGVNAKTEKESAEGNINTEEEIKTNEVSDKTNEVDSLNELHSNKGHIETAAKENHWKDIFIDMIRKLLNENVSNIQFIKEDKDSNNADEPQEKQNIKNHIENTKSHSTDLFSDDEENITIERVHKTKYINEKIEIDKDTSDIEEIDEQNIRNVNKDEEINTLNENIDSIDTTGVINHTTIIDDKDYDCEYVENEDSNSETKEHDTKRNKTKPNIDVEQSDELNNTNDSEIIKNLFKEFPQNLSEDAVIILDTNPDEIDINNTNLDHKIISDNNFFEESINKGNFTHNDMQEEISLVNKSENIAVEEVESQINSNEKEPQPNNTFTENTTKEFEKEINKPTVTTNAILSNEEENDNSCEDISEKQITNDNERLETENFATNHVSTEYNEINPPTDYTENSLHFEELQKESITQNLPEVLSLRLEDTGEEFLEYMESKRDRTKPLWVYIQEKRGQDQYVFLNK